MKNTKCRVISEFKGKIAGYTINDHESDSLDYINERLETGYYTT